jgi:hypothetical protein
MGDLRRDNRLAFGGKISLIWASANGDPCARNGECIDVSSSGLKVKVDSQIPTRTVVTVKARELALHGSASVRSCTRVGARYIIGLEFVGGMKWEVPPALAAAMGSGR